MHSTVIFQASVFGDYLSIIPTLEVMNLLANVPTELEITLLPSTTNVVNLNTFIQEGGTAPPTAVQRINMVDTNQRWSITILPERIDVSFNQQNIEDEEAFETIASKASVLLRKTINDLSVNFYRMAVNCTTQFENKNDCSTTALFDMLIKPMHHQIGRESIEWQVVSNCPREITLDSNHKELLNVISAVAWQVNPVTVRPAITAQFDVNTDAQNLMQRFSCDKLGTFCTTAVGMTSDFIRDIEEKMINV